MIQPVNALTPKVSFKGQYSEFQNPVNRRMEKRLAILNAGGVSVATGAVTTAIARSYTSSWTHASWFGLGATAITMLFVCPRFMYKSGIKSYTKEKELDVFTKEKEVQKKLLNDVDDAIEHHSDDLHDKLENYSKTKITDEKNPNKTVKIGLP